MLEKSICRVSVEREDMRLPEKFVQAVSEAENIDYMYGMLLEMVSKW